MLARMRLGAYEVVSELGRGGMGVVFRAHSPEGRDVAIKLLQRRDEPTLARFERERRLLASLGEKDGFVPLLDAGSSPQGPFLVMPLVPGGTLRARLAGGALGVKEALELGHRLGEALGRAHARGVVHRDLKPENVLFAADGRALVADLGLAKHFDRGAPGASQSVSLSLSGEVRGTAGYMAPEQVADTRAAGPPADVFALGAIVWECLAGRPAFAAGTVLEIFAAAARGSANLPPLGRSDLPFGVEETLRRALDPRPGARFPDGATFARALAGTPGRRGGRRALVLAGVAAAIALSVAVARWRSRAASRAEARAFADQALRAQEDEDSRGARAAIDRAIELAPDSAAFLAFRAEQRACDAAQRNGGEAERVLALADADRALALDPGAALAWAARGVVLQARGDLPGALHALTRAVELQPQNATTWLDRAVAKQAMGDRSGALADAGKAAVLAPGSVLPLDMRACVRRTTGDLAGALSEMDQAIARVPGRAASWWLRADIELEQKDLAGALRDATRAIELEPRGARGWGLRAEVRLKRGDLDGTISDATRAIELDPTLARALEERGVARTTKNDLAGAIEDLTRAIELDPKLASAWGNRAFARTGTKEWGKAMDDASRAIELRPNLAWAWFVRAQARDATNDTAGAIADATRALELDPKLASAWTTRAMVRQQTDDVEGAIADASQAIELDPGLARAWSARAYARAKKGEVEGALRDFRKVVELVPDDPEVAKIRQNIAALEARLRR